MTTKAKNNEKKYTLTRTGDVPVTFTGVLLAEAAEPLEPLKGDKDFRRWHEIRLYKTKTKKFVISIIFRTNMRDEHQQDTIFVCDDQHDVGSVLTDTDNEDSYDPLEFLHGFPNHERFRERQDRLESRIIADYESRVSRIMALAGFAEAI